MDRIKLVVTDMDQTLLRTDKKISNFTYNTIKSLNKYGILFAVATAQPEQNIRHYFKDFKPDFIISSGGALVKKQKEKIFECIINKKSCKLFFDFILNSNDIGVIFFETSNRIYHKNMRLENKDEIFVFLKNLLNESIMKITFQLFDEKMINMWGKNIPYCYFIKHSNEKWFSFSDVNATKYHALCKILDIGGMYLNEVIAFGDDYNDLEMIRKCGYGVGVSNCIQEIIECADFITKSNNEDGVAEFLLNIFNQQNSIEVLV